MKSNYGGTEWFQYLCKAFLTLETEQEAAEFLSDLCTVSELRSMSQRLQVSKLLYTNYVYTDIVKETGASTATISRVNRTLHDIREIDGKGYQTVLSRLGAVPAENTAGTDAASQSSQ